MTREFDTIELNIRVASPAGNTTIFVLDAVERKDYAVIARALLEKSEYGAEQVAFITGENSMEMSGLEFCGNASRAFALMVAEARGVTGRSDIPVRVSGAEHPLTVSVVPEIRYARIEMPLHRGVHPAELGGTVVDLGGIVHLVLEDEPAAAETNPNRVVLGGRFDALKKRIVDRYHPPALGVMFCHESRMIPIVYVEDVDSTYFEGSCGSGTTACAIARTMGKPDGSYTYRIDQPAGSLVAVATAAGGDVTSVTIEGEVTIGPVMTVAVDLPAEEYWSVPEEFLSDEYIKSEVLLSEGDGAFPSIQRFKEMTSEVLDELPEAFFDELSGGVIVSEEAVLSDYAQGNDEFYVMGTYNVGHLGRQIRIYYGSFRKTYPSISEESLEAQIRRVVRHEFRHHMEFRSGVHGKDSLEEEDYQQKMRYLRRKRS